MRLAYVITRADAVGGATIHVRDLAAAMLARGHEVRVFLGGQGAVTRALEAVGVPFTSLEHLRRAIHPWHDFEAYLELRRALRAYAPDLISTHTAKAGWIGRAAAHSLGIPAIYTPHGWAISDRISPVGGRVFAAAERVAARWSAAIVCVCEYERQLAIEKGVARPEQLHVIPNGVHDVPESLVSNPGAEGPPEIVSVARFEAPKDHETLLRAFGALRDLAWTLTLVGDGPNEAAMRTLAAELGIAHRVRFAGYMADPAEALARAQLFVLSSRSEAFPRSILEAMRAGLPVVASTVGGVAEAVINGTNWLLVPSNEVPALASALRCMILNPRERQLQGERARQIWCTRYRFERLLEGTERLYATLIGGTPRE